MKSVFSFLALLLLASCGSGTASDTDKALTSRHQPADPVAAADPVKVYASFLLMLDTNDVSSMSKANLKFNELFQQSPSDVADKAYIHFEDFYNRMDRHLNDFQQQHYEEYNLYTYADTAGNFHLPAKVKNYQNKLISNGFILRKDGEGGTYVSKRRQAVFRSIETPLSAPMKQYLHEVDKEETDWLAIDGGIAVTEQEYVRRLIFWEDFMKHNPDFAYRKEAEETYRDLLTWFLAGMPNSPVYQDENGALEPYFDKAYSQLAKNYPRSETNKKVEPYFKLLKEQKTSEAEKLVRSYQKKGYTLNYRD